MMVRALRALKPGEIVYLGVDVASIEPGELVDALGVPLRHEPALEHGTFSNGSTWPDITIAGVIEAWRQLEAERFRRYSRTWFQCVAEYRGHTP